MKKFTIAVMFLALVFTVSAAPKPGDEYDPQQWKHDDNPCVHNGGRMEICQRCAKQTKSPIVYPMCCNDVENVLDWCNKYINYGSFP